jgi:uncharacterized protein (DUF1499 family)
MAPFLLPAFIAGIFGLVSFALTIRYQLCDFRISAVFFILAFLLISFSLIGSFYVFYSRLSNAATQTQVLIGCGLVVVLLLSFVIFKVLPNAAKIPRIHDITTDTAHPPQFTRLNSNRTGALNSLEYGGPKVAELQQKAYPDIQTLRFPVKPAEIFQRALVQVQKLGWEIALSDQETGIIEATAATPLIGFRDYVIIRITADQQQQMTSIDMRSVSRVGASDLGANAARIRSFLQHL